MAANEVVFKIYEKFLDILRQSEMIKIHILMEIISWEIL